ncbi:MAG: helix-turn-helix domain-containing protein [Thermotogae bacterium]|nr:helix-turn-helix domain-containing protein [Thermotogota bacterium]
MKTKRELALSLLAEGLSQREVAERAGVSERTLRRWLKEESFKRELEARIKEKVKNELFRAVLSKNELSKRKRTLVELIDTAIQGLDLSKPYAVDVLVKYLKTLDDMERRRVEALLDIYKKHVDTEKKEEELETIRIVIEGLKSEK